MIIVPQGQGVWKQALDAFNKDSFTVNPIGVSLERTVEKTKIYTGPKGLILWSSGSTGESKGVIIPWDIVSLRCQQVSKALDYTSSSVVFCGSAGYHNFGIVSAALAANSVGAEVVEPQNLKQNFSMSEALRNRHITHALLLTEQVQYLAERNLFHGLDIERIYVGGSKFTPELKDKIKEQSGATVVDSFGTTETGTIAKVKDVGFTPYPDVQARERDGRIEWKTPGLAWGTLDGPLKTNDGWWTSDDEGYVENGKVFLSPRKVEKKSLWQNQNGS